MLFVLIGVLAVMFVLAVMVSERRAGKRAWDAPFWTSSVLPPDSDASCGDWGDGFDDGGGGDDGGGC